MEQRELPQGKAVRVFWHDSASSNGWTKLAGGIVKLSSIGYVVEADEDFLAISSSIDDNPVTGFYDVLSIPWGCIAQVQELGANLDRITT